MITSRLDYCSTTLTGVADEQIARIQKIQNNAARLILKKSKRDHVTPLLKELHWLPVKYRIQYKLAMLAFCHFDGTLPPCTCLLLSAHINHRAPFVLQQKDCSKFQKQT